MAFFNVAILFSHSIEEKRYDHPLYPISKPREEGYLKVSSLHTLFYALYGNPSGIPIVVVHGGPGAGCSDEYACFFDLNRWNVIMFDQRGAVRSQPFGCMEENTPHHSVNDIELLRKHLGVEKWMVFGGSWGSALSLLYGQKHSESCLGFILRGIFLAREQDYLHIFYSLGKICPEVYEPCLQYIPQNEREDLIAAYYRRVMDPDPQVHMPAAFALITFIASCWTYPPSREIVNKLMQNTKPVLSCAKALLHYSMHGFFLKPNQILSCMEKMTQLPGIIIHGSRDVLDPPEMAYLLHEKWKNSVLWMIPNGGHSAFDPAIAPALATATDIFAQKLWKN